MSEHAPTLAPVGAALPPEGAGPALGRPGGGAVTPTLAPEGKVILHQFTNFVSDFLKGRFTC